MDRQPVNYRGIPERWAIFGALVFGAIEFQSTQSWGNAILWSLLGYIMGFWAGYLARFISSVLVMVFLFFLALLILGAFTTFPG